eukprot:scaffold4431_cov81-Skeletonema_marinoi.AAC.1
MALIDKLSQKEPSSLMLLLLEKDKYVPHSARSWIAYVCVLSGTGWWLNGYQLDTATGYQLDTSGHWLDTSDNQWRPVATNLATKWRPEQSRLDTKWRP